MLTSRAGERDRAVIALFDAWNNRPQRAEPLYELAWMFRDRKQDQLAHFVSERGLHIPVPPDTLFVHRWIYQWGLLFEYSIAAYWVGQPRAALEACDRLLAMPELPEPYREQTNVNRTHCERAVTTVPSRETAVARLAIGIDRSSSSATAPLRPPETGSDQGDGRGAAP